MFNIVCLIRNVLCDGRSCAPSMYYGVDSAGQRVSTTESSRLSAELPLPPSPTNVEQLGLACLLFLFRPIVFPRYIVELWIYQVFSGEARKDSKG